MSKGWTNLIVNFNQDSFELRRCCSLFLQCFEHILRQPNWFKTISSKKASFWKFHRIFFYTFPWFLKKIPVLLLVRDMFKHLSKKSPISQRQKHIRAFNNDFPLLPPFPRMNLRPAMSFLLKSRRKFKEIQGFKPKKAAEWLQKVQMHRFTSPNLIQID